MAHKRSVIPAVVLSALVAAVALPCAAAPASAATAAAAAFDGTTFCPASGTITKAAAATLTDPAVTDRLLAEGATVRNSTAGPNTYEYANWEYYDPTTDRYLVHDLWYGTGIGEVRMYDFTSGTRYDRYTSKADNAVEVGAVKRLGGATVWVRSAPERTRQTLAEDQMRLNLMSAAWVLDDVSDGDAKATCSVSGTTVTYVVTYDDVVATSTVTFTDDGAPTAMHEVRKGPGSARYTTDTTITYGATTSTVTTWWPKSTAKRTALKTWRSAVSKEALAEIQTFAAATAKAKVKKATTQKKRVSALRAAVKAEKAYLSSYYFNEYYSSWVPTVHFTTIANGEKVSVTDPATSKALWVTLTVKKGTTTIVKKDNF